MDIKDLNNSDIIWLALFVSFMTAIVTGIVVVFLYPQKLPPSVNKITDNIEQKTGDYQSTSMKASQTAGGSGNSTTKASRNDQSTTTKPEGTSTTPKRDGDANDQPTRDEVLAMSEKAVARVIGAGMSAKAGVLLRLDEGRRVVTSMAGAPALAQATFTHEGVADLSRESAENLPGFVKYEVDESSGKMFPLASRYGNPKEGESAYVVPLSNRPRISRVTIEAVKRSIIKTSARSFPAVSLLLNMSGDVIGLYDDENANFRRIPK